MGLWRMSVKCIALDLDGTTLFDDKHITEGNRSAIASAISKGVHIVVASGRCFHSIPRCITEIPGIEYAITSNGAAVYELASGQCIQRFPLDADDVATIFELVKPYDAGYEVFYDGNAYSPAFYIDNPERYGILPQFIQYIQSTRIKTDNIEQFICDHIDSLDSIDFLINDRARYAQLLDTLHTHVPNVYITSSGVHRLEIASKEAGKHNGLSFVLDRLGIGPESAAAFGDGDNDTEMLAYVQYGFAVENAAEKCKAAATHIVPANTEDGVAIGFKLLGL